MSFPNTEAICRVSDPLNWTPEKISLMVNACREMALFHAANNNELRYLYKKYNFDPNSIQSEKDLMNIPSIGVTAMKYFLLTSLPESDALLKLTSSGTKGQKTQIWFDGASLERVQAMLQVLWEQEQLISDEPTNYLMLIYDPQEAKDLGIAFSLKNQQRFAPPHQTYYAVKKNKNGEWQLHAKEATAVLKKYIKEDKPVRITGITAFIYELLSELEKKQKIKLPKRSFVFTGGGWKAADDKKVSRLYFREKASKLLGIPPDYIRDGYGMAEHSSPYIECKNHRFHIPVYNRIVARDPVTMNVLPKGEPGLLELITPFNAMMPNLAVLSTDIGYIDSDNCLCGWGSPTFTLVGRAGLTKHKGCAITASEIVKKDGIR